MELGNALLVAFLVLYLPLALLFVVLVVANRNAESRPTPLPVPGRRLLIAICSNGEAAPVVGRIIRRLESYRLGPMGITAIVEESDTSDYGVPTVIVPAAYRPPNGSLDKHRALHYFSQWLRRNGYGPETYVVHLDDDSIVTRRYLEHVLGMQSEAGQGALRLRAIGDHWFSTVADFGRAINCATYCTFFNQRGRPVGVHGEGLVLRADVESELGWDFQPVCAEDFLMGQSVVNRGFRFDFIPGGIYIAPPTSTRDFYEQRRRWVHRFFASLRNCWSSNPAATAWFVWQALGGGLVAIGLASWAVLTLAPSHPAYALLAGTTFCFVVTLIAYQWQASQTGMVRWNLIALALFVPAAAYNSCTFFYYLFTRRPQRWVSIRKV
ncbi:MAG TPA: glycosyltransferase family 2 protein [Thermoplasmata archaeon]|nr:glycosyltransferase family 2 protein [Thermoplasmata archaeon]